jgi:SAM-dependent methyltransferase
MFNPAPFAPFTVANPTNPTSSTNSTNSTNSASGSLPGPLPGPHTHPPVRTLTPPTAVGLCLRWSSAIATHQDCMALPLPRGTRWPTRWQEWLVQRGYPDTAWPTMPLALAPGEGLADWVPEALVTVPRERFRHSPGQQVLVPVPGRFYPVGLLEEGTAGIPRGTRLFRIVPSDTAPGTLTDTPPDILPDTPSDTLTDTPSDIAADADGSLLLDCNLPLAGLPLELSLHPLGVSLPGTLPEDPLQALAMQGPGMQARWRGRAARCFTATWHYTRADAAPDGEFYRQPRLVQHLDATAQAQIQALYHHLLPQGARILDLMSSWTSHLHPAVQPAWVAGLGLNAEELAANPLLQERVVQDLNQDATLPWPNACFDAVLCTVSLEYLIRPVDVLQEVHRVLRPGGWCIASFSNRWFPPKAILPWAELHEFERLGLVTEWFLAAGLRDLHTFSLRGLPRPANDRYAQRLRHADPVYAVWGQAAQPSAEMSPRMVTDGDR